MHTKFAIYLDLDMIYLHLPFRLLLIYYLHICKVEAHTQMLEQVCVPWGRVHVLTLWSFFQLHSSMLLLSI